MRRSLAFAALSALTLAIPAHATTTLTPADGVINVSSGSGVFGATTTDSGQFTNNFTFNVGSGQYGNVHVVTTNAGDGTGEVSFSSIAMDGQQLSLLYSSGTNQMWGFQSPVWFNQGTSNIVIEGTSYATSTRSASYSGVVSLGAAAVPEPGAWGLLLVGFVAMGGVMRRRQRTRVSYS